MRPTRARTSRPATLVEVASAASSPAVARFRLTGGPEPRHLRFQELRLVCLSGCPPGSDGQSPVSTTSEALPVDQVSLVTGGDEVTRY